MATDGGPPPAATQAGPSKWNGDEADWPTFKFEFLNWSRRHGADLPRMLKAAEDLASVLLADMTEEVGVTAGRIMTDLSLKTVDRAQRLLMNLEESDNGFEAWKALVRMGEGGGGIKKAGL